MYKLSMITLCALFCLAAVPAFAGEAAAPHAELTLEELLAPEIGAEAACDTPVLDAEAASSCTHGRPTCQVHDDCDAYCGSPEFGYCEKLGHFPSGCCSCLG